MGGVDLPVMGFGQGAVVGELALRWYGVWEGESTGA